MRIREILSDDDRFLDMLESASAGATGSASIASVVNPMGAINRRPSLFGYIPQQTSSGKRKAKKRK